mmetsp:Transcript_29742/g.65821  ORF Transcript_29742/g.65821 Transcript_29742/m.65821 type:complete len:260 (-) Transcript_29742:259-1038(-)
MQGDLAQCFCQLGSDTAVLALQGQPPRAPLLHKQGPAHEGAAQCPLHGEAPTEHIQQVGVGGEPRAGQCRCRLHQLGPGQLAVPPPCQLQTLQLHWHCYGCTPIQGGVGLAIEHVSSCSCRRCLPGVDEDRGPIGQTDEQEITSTQSTGKRVQHPLAQRGGHSSVDGVASQVQYLSPHIRATALVCCHHAPPLADHPAGPPPVVRIGLRGGVQRRAAGGRGGGVPGAWRAPCAMQRHWSQQQPPEQQCGQREQHGGTKA